MTKKFESSVLDDIVIALPCSVPWDSMQGEEERKRTCQACSKSVYNVSNMSRAEVEELLNENGINVCLSIYRRNDGTIMTDECPRALRKIRDRLRLAGKIVAGALAFLFFQQPATAQRLNLGTNGGPRQIRSWDKPKSNYVTSDELLEWSEKTQSNRPKIVQPPTVTNVNINQNPAVTVNGNSKQQTSNEAVEPLAYRYYEIARKASELGQTDRTERYLQKSLDAFDKQKAKGDPKFRALIEQELGKLRNAKTKPKAQCK